MIRKGQSYHIRRLNDSFLKTTKSCTGNVFGLSKGNINLLKQKCEIIKYVSVQGTIQYHME